MLISILIIAGITFITRAIPFWFFKEGRVPKYISYLGEHLPKALMGMLVVYALKGTIVSSYPHGIPELIAVIVTVLVHKYKGNVLLSIGISTAVYMYLVQTIFI